MSLESQSLRMDLIPNARDLKGYVMQDGRRVKAGRLLRSGDLSKASDRDIQRLREEFHLAVDFDFRMEMEVSQSPDRPVEGAEYFFLPTLDAREALQELCEKTHAEPIQHIGRRFVLYRASRENPRIVVE